MFASLLGYARIFASFFWVHARVRRPVLRGMRACSQVFRATQACSHRRTCELSQVFRGACVLQSFWVHAIVCRCLEVGPTCACSPIFHVFAGTCTVLRVVHACL